MVRMPHTDRMTDADRTTPEHSAPTSAIAVCCDSDRATPRQRADELARHLALPRADCASHDYPLLLAVTDDRLELRQTDSADGAVFCEFTEGRFGYRRTLPLAHELLARAVGFKGQPLDVIDMTAGLGRDAMVLSLLGCHVTAIESHPVVSELLEDGLRRAGRDPETARSIAGRLQLVRGDAEQYLAALPTGTLPDVIYLDPMFPPRTQSALMKKELRALARLVGADIGDGAHRLLRAAFATGCRRVVVKRPRKAPDLLIPGWPPPGARFEGRAARFDVYFPAGVGAT